MEQETPAQAALARRVARIERTNWLLLAAVLVSGAALLTAATRSQDAVRDVVRARTVEIVDDAGRVRMELTHDTSGTRLYVHDDAGDVRIGVAQFAHGGGGVALHGPGGRGAAVLYLKGTGSLTLYDSAGTVAARWPAAQ